MTSLDACSHANREEMANHLKAIDASLERPDALGFSQMVLGVGCGLFWGCGIVTAVLLSTRERIGLLWLFTLNLLLSG